MNFFVTNVKLSLKLKNTLKNEILAPAIQRSKSTFTASFTLRCGGGYHGPNCTVYCKPSDSNELGHYSCHNNGSIQCLEGYQNETTNCTECAVTEKCKLLTSESLHMLYSLSPIFSAVAPLLRAFLCSS